MVNANRDPKRGDNAGPIVSEHAPLSCVCLSVADTDVLVSRTRECTQGSWSMNTLTRPSAQRASSLHCRWLMLMLVSLPWLGGNKTIRAQSVTATLVGTVADQSGAGVPRANLTLTMVGTNVKRTVLSGDSGDFPIAGPSPGTYLL